MAETNATVEKTRGRAKTREGLVVSDKMDKTIVVAITQKIMHKEYKKYVRRTRKYFAHDAENKCEAGDTVRIVETRPLSKNKRWRVQEVLKKGVKV